MRSIMTSLVALLTACTAPSGHGDLHQGAIRPPAARPGVGLHVSGQSRTEVHAPRSPHTRVLPPTEESGVWAGDEPTAANTTADGPSVKVDLLEWPVQIPAPVLPELVVIHANKCVDMAEALGGALPAGMDYTTLDPAARRCFAAEIMGACIRFRLGRVASGGETRQRPNKEANMQALSMPAKWAEAVKRACRPQRHKYQNMFDFIAKQWEGGGE